MKENKGPFGFLAAQSAVCVVVIASALLLRFVGGDLFEELRALFQTVIYDDALGAALLEQWQRSVSL